MDLRCAHWLLMIPEYTKYLGFQWANKHMQARLIQVNPFDHLTPPLYAQLLLDSSVDLFQYR